MQFTVEAEEEVVRQLAENSFTASILTPAEKVRWIGELNDFARG